MALFPFLEFFCLLSAFATCAIGFYVFAKNPLSPINRLFLASMLGGTYWALGEFFIWQSGTPEGVLFWLKFSAFWPVVIILTFHFVLALTEHPLAQAGRPRFMLTGLYVLAAGFSLVGLFTSLTRDVIYRPGPGYVYAPVTTSPVYIAESLFIVLVMIWAVAAVLSAWKAASGDRKRSQVRLICAGILTTIFFGGLSGIILPFAGIYIPNLVFIGIVLFSLIIAYAITQYGLFTLSTESAIPDILRTMPDGLLLFRPDGRIIAANPSAGRILQAGEAEITGRLASAFIPEPAYSTIMTAIREQGSFLDLEAAFGTSAATVVSIAGSRVNDPGGEPAGIVLILRDIGSRKKQERALRVANEKISLVTRLTRHDINNLVTGLAGYLLLLEDINTTPPGDAYVQTSLTLLDRISRQLRFSSDFLHIGTYQPDWQSLGSLICRAENDLPHDGVEITVQVPQVEIYADPLSVKVVYNLLENALRHGQHLTRISITAGMNEKGELVVIFEDNGGGVAAAEKGQIFEYGVGKHTGLGLAFSRDILQETGITIAETGSEGVGARFEIRVPPASWRRM